ncbi:MAG: PHP domain-containing protein [Gemmatimonadaceae bacterium]|nr:PHP domain-containing protein [Gemmatimonadaceae bacterium]
MTDGRAPDAVPPGPCIDLHLHSTASDGSRSPEDVVASALAAGLHTIALTDHDTVAGVAAARKAAEGSSLTVIAGVELSAYQGDEETHLLGLHIEDVDAMDAGLHAFREARHARGEAMVARLNAIGVKITFADVLEQAGEGAIGRPHVAKALVEHGWARDLRDAFDRYLGNGRPAYLEKRRLTMRDAIAMVHDCGGLAVLAHPGQHGNKARLAALQIQGLDGAEVLHPSHGLEDRRRLLEAVDALGMVPSGGSDSHGAVEGPRVIGAMRVPLAWLERQRERLAERRRGARVA